MTYAGGFGVHNLFFFVRKEYVLFVCSFDLGLVVRTQTDAKIFADNFFFEKNRVFNFFFCDFVL